MGAFDEFIRTRRSEATRKVYRKGVLYITKEPDKLLDLALKEPKSVEDFLVSYFSDQTSSGTWRHNQLSAIKSFFEDNDVELKWRRITKVIPPARKIGSDRAPSREEIAKLLEVCGLKERMIVLCMSSGGFRVGAWKFLKIRHLKFLEGGITKLTIYAGEDRDEHFTFISPEATNAVKEYLELRKRLGDPCDPDEPVLIGRWGYYEGRPDRAKNRKIKGVTTQGVQSLLFDAWGKTGIRKAEGDRHEFKNAHGFRKYFKTNFPACESHAQLDCEILLGHKLGIEGSYFKPSDKHLEEVYRKAVPYLSISNELRLENQLTEKELKYEEKAKELEAGRDHDRIRILELEKRDADRERKLNELFEKVEDEIRRREEPRRFKKADA